MVGEGSTIKLHAMVEHNTESVCTGEQLLLATEQLKLTGYRYTVETPSNGYLEAHILRTASTTRIRGHDGALPHNEHLGECSAGTHASVLANPLHNDNM